MVLEQRPLPLKCTPGNENEPERNSLLHRILVSDELIPAESITVWIDPLDATKEYTEGLKQYVTTMVGIGSFYSSLDHPWTRPPQDVHVLAVLYFQILCSRSETPDDN